MRAEIRQAIMRNREEEELSEQERRAFKRWMVIIPLGLYIDIKMYGIRHDKPLAKIVTEALRDWLKKDKRTL